MAAIQIMTVSSKSEAQLSVDTKKQTMPDGIQGMFSDYMKQSQAGNSKLASQNNEFISGSAEKSGSPVKEEYTQYQSKSVSDRVGQKQDYSSNDSKAKVVESVDQAAQTVKDVIKEELGVEEEQIAEAMEMLGLTAIDLLNPQNLMNLVMTLTDATDSGILLFDPGFQNILDEINIVSQNLAEELGMPIQELVPLLKTQDTESLLPDDFQEILSNENVIQPETLQVVNSQLQTMEVGQTDQQRLTTDHQTEQVENTQTNVNTGREVFAAHTSQVVQDENKNVKQNEIITDSKNEPETVQVVQHVETSTTEDSDQSEQMFDDQSTKQNHTEQSHTEQLHVNQNDFVAASPIQQSTSDIPVVQSPQGNVPLPQVDIQNIMEQIVEYTRTNLTETVKSIEMQLNPENLGKVYLHITEKAGAVTAQIATQNETMKDALMQQAVVLKENLNQQGIKVEAVEVSVGTHEFEDNLEKDARQQEEQARQEEATRRQSRRSLDLNNLDELTGLMTEEEELAARIMRDNGNNVDYKA